MSIEKSLLECEGVDDFKDHPNLKNMYSIFCYTFFSIAIVFFNIFNFNFIISNQVYTWRFSLMQTGWLPQPERTIMARLDEVVINVLKKHHIAHKMLRRLMVHPNHKCEIEH